MRKLVLPLLAFAFLACGSAVAQSSNAAIVINSGTGLCGMPGSDANGDIIFGGIGNITLEVQNDNKVEISCHGTNLTNASGKAQSFNGFGCGIFSPKGVFYITTNSHATVAADGSGDLQCIYKP